jgi:hypothetical protein
MPNSSIDAKPKTSFKYHQLNKVPNIFIKIIERNYGGDMWYNPAWDKLSSTHEAVKFEKQVIYFQNTMLGQLRWSLFYIVWQRVLSFLGRCSTT